MDLAALGELDAGAGLGHRNRHIGHRDRLAECRRETARGDLADLRAVAVEHLTAVKRAGADVILTYFARELAETL